jgi:hypothetical protein
MKKVSVNQAIIDAIELSEPGMGRHMNFLIKKAKYIEKAIGSNLAHPVKALNAHAHGCKVDVPDDCFAIMSILIGSHADECNASFLSHDTVLMVEYDEDIDPPEVFTWIPAQFPFIRRMLWREEGDYLNLVDQYQDQDITIVFQKIETDPDGMWLVSESHIDAITKFLIHQYAKKYQFKAMMSDKMVRNNYLQQLASYERDYSIAVRSARSDDARDFPYRIEGY